MGHLLNTRLGDVCLYYKCSLSLKVIDVSYLQECIKDEVKTGEKNGTSSFSIDFLAKQKINLRVSLKI